MFDGGLAAPVGGVGVVDDQVGREAAQLVGASADRVLVVGELGGIAANAGPDVLRDDVGLADIEESGAVGAGQGEGHRLTVRDGDIFDESYDSSLVEGRVGFHEIEGELDIGAGEGLAVVPLDVRAQVEGQLATVAGKLIAGRQPGMVETRGEVRGVEHLVEQALRTPGSGSIVVEEWVEKVSIGAVRRRQDPERICLGGRRLG
ncbi:hypothetical protein A4R35_16770 [Thermogemmatispora tikiterensis]|uniref:Uncharacterized protein n=1 Tax=Thermogemmatispora tikiterensis TaxID=1825093 RepID=A0A328VPU1_9CHLR|nr:hypothetical protein A4R35_16770 [Thermogemmatispora tikiterensis]